MGKIDELIEELCPEGVTTLDLGSLCRIETGRRDANEASPDGEFLFFTTARETSRIDSYRWDCEALLIAGNANVGNVKHFVGKFDAYQRTYVLSDFPQGLEAKYLFYSLQNNLNYYLDSNKNVAAMTYIVLGTLKAFQVPIPPLEAQKEIVSILDKFTQLEAELEAELEARRIQYEVTRDRLLDFSDILQSHPVGEMIRELCPEGVSFAQLRTVASIGTGSSDKKDSDTDGPYPFFVRSKQVYRSQTFEFEETAILIPGEGGIGEIFHFHQGPYALHQRAYRVAPNAEQLEPKFLFYFMIANFKQHILARAVSATVTSIRKPMIESFPVALPPLEIQREIVSILDKLDTLVNDITIGLPAEISARRKQYEHYRNKLLTFKELEAA